MTRLLISCAAVLLTALAGLVVPIVIAPAYSATIEWRPDLADRVEALKPVFPREGPISVKGPRDPFLVDWLIDAQDRGLTLNPVMISGVIEPGDAEAFRALVADTYNVVVIFDSPGGSFTEGFALGGELVDMLGGNDAPALLGVYVLEGQRCMSACAVAFARVADLDHASAADIRYVERGGQLGFHMPFLPEDLAEQTGRAGELLDLSYDITGLFNELLIGGANPPTLMREILKYRTADEFYVLRGGRDTWSMGFTPVADGGAVRPSGQVALDLETVTTLCQFSFVHGRMVKAGSDMEFTQFAWALPEEIPLVSEMVDETGATSFAIGSETGHSCGFTLNDDGTYGIAVWYGAQGCTPARDPFDADYSWCPVTLNRTSTVTAGFVAEALGCADGTYTSASSFMTPRIEREVNMRAGPSTEDEVLGQAQPGMEFEITGCRVTADSQDVWYEIQTPGQGGWISARFVGGRDFLGAS
ncbi:SH3 domain-containing protein [Cucumibacter marinus]|uniref:SH3 domain-containing protein n=1 Tax=Cucumibacter marinus TaxID=1121252 RepID=UPI000491EAC1|nr:SH3 domain-containing protein [Cucumibacter marinus]